jgi:hypothetical protein
MALSNTFSFQFQLIEMAYLLVIADTSIVMAVSKVKALYIRWLAALIITQRTTTMCLLIYLYQALGTWTAQAVSHTYAEQCI